jgi:RNA polymerase sigma-70 factor (ECF subfamily)
MQPDIDALVAAAARGDGAALNALLAEHLPGLRAFVRLRMDPLLRAQESSSDLVQSVCREILQHSDRFKFEGQNAFRRWLYTEALRKIAHRKEHYLAARRDLRRQVDLGGGGSEDDLLSFYASFCSPSRVAIAREELARVEQAFDALPDHYRDLIVKARILGMTRAELAAESGTSEGAIGNMLFRAMAALAEKLTEEH